MRILLKQALVLPTKKDGARVLVDRMWPRGIRKEAAMLKAWLKELAPSAELCKWFRDRPTQWPLFKRKYFEELADPTASRALETLHEMADENATLTLVFAAKDEEHNAAVVLKELLEGERKPPASSGPAKAAAGAQRARGRR
jgi:uncharacterized protein YeaO (DUF488 family)